MDWKRIAIYTLILSIATSIHGFLPGPIWRAISTAEIMSFNQFFLLINLALLCLQAAILFFFVKKLTENVVLNSSLLAIVYLLIVISIHLSIGGFEHLGRMFHIYVVFILALVLAVLLGNASNNWGQSNNSKIN